MENQQYFNELAERLANKEITCEQAIALFKVVENPITKREQALLDVIRHLRDYISNDNIPVEDSDRLYRESLELADEVLLEEAKQKHCWSCDNALTEDEKGAYPIDVNETGNAPDIRFQCEECRAAL